MVMRTLTPVQCECGCGKSATVDPRRNRVSRFVSGHNSRVLHGMTGKTHTPETRAKIKAARARQTNVGGGGPIPRSAGERFDEKVYYEPNTGCHLWGGAVGATGYGVFGVEGSRTISAHIYADNRVNGPIPDGLERDHICNVRSCVNPVHIERVTHAENLRRAGARRLSRRRS